MPIQVKYTIRCTGKIAPYENTYDFDYARAALSTYQRKAQRDEMFYCTTEVKAEEPLTKDEQYLMLVYEVRRLIKRYFDNGRKTEDLKASPVKEAQLDGWNARTRSYIDSKPGFEKVLKNLPIDSDKYRHFSFFEVVEEWRKVWKEYHRYKKQKDKDPAVEREMKKKCYDFEKTIDNYIRFTLKLI